MASRAPVWGIDVGQCSLKAIKLQQSGDQVEMLAFDVVEHETILSQAETDATAIIIKAIETFVGRNDLRGSRVVVSVPGQQTLTRFTKMPPVEPKKIPDMVQYEASQQIPFDLDEVVWDYQVFTDKDSPDVEVGIFAIRKELIRNHLAQFLGHGIEPMMVQASPMASYNACQFEQLGDEGKATILLDMGALATDLIVAEGGRIWSRPVPIGGNRFTEALVTAFKLSFKKAEHLKRNAATSKHARQVFNAMRPVFADLVSEVQRSIGFYTSTHRDAHITRVVGMGNAFKLPGLQKFLQQNLQIEVDRLSALNKVAASAAQQSPAFADNVMSFSVAYGLAVQGLGLGSVNSNLLPLEITKTVLWRKKQPWFIAAAACLMLSAASIWVGNTMANGQLTTAMGSLTEPSVVRARDAEQAEQILSSPGAEAPVEKAAKIVGAAQALKAALDEVDRKRTGDIGALRSMAKLPENNVYLPRIIAVIHRGFDQAKPPGLKSVKTIADFLQYASQVERSVRRDFWIERLQVLYHASDAASYFPHVETAGEGSSPRAGWAIQITGATTDPRPAKWLEEELLAALKRLGRQPGRGFFFASVRLAKVTKKPISTESGESAVDDSPGRGAGPGTRGGGGDRGLDGPRGGGGARGGRPRPLDFGGGGGGGAGADTGSTRTIGEAIFKFREQLNTEDALTGESTVEDHRFVIEIVVSKGSTPTNMIPDEYKPKKPDEAGTAHTQPKGS